MKNPDPAEACPATKTRMASLGQIVFDDDVDDSTGAAIRQMWVDRLAGFNGNDLARYLLRNTAETHYLVNGKMYSFRAFRRMARIVFTLRAAARFVGLHLTAEVLDARVARNGDGYVTRGVLVVMLCGRIIRQSRLVFTITNRGGSLVWDHATDVRIRRSHWPYARPSSSKGDSPFERLSSGR